MRGRITSRYPDGEIASGTTQVEDTNLEEKAVRGRRVGFVDCPVATTRLGYRSKVFRVWFGSPTPKLYLFVSSSLSSCQRLLHTA